MNILFREDIVKLPSIPLCFDDNFGIIMSHIWLLNLVEIIVVF